MSQGSLPIGSSSASQMNQRLSQSSSSPSHQQGEGKGSSIDEKRIIPPLDPKIGLVHNYLADTGLKDLKVRKVYCLDDLEEAPSKVLRDDSYLEKTPHSIWSRDVDYDLVVFFEASQVVSRLWAKVAQENAPNGDFLEGMAFAEKGDLSRLKAWSDGDQTRLLRQTEEGETLLYGAFLGNQLATLKWLYEVAPSLRDRIRKDQKSLLFLSVLEGKQEIFDFFIGEGLIYSPSRFIQEAKRFGYEKEVIKRALEGMNWNIRNIPSKNPYFTGREEILADLETRFSSNHLQYLVGAEGVGKSALASFYAHQHQSSYSIVWWVEGHHTPRSSLKDLAIELGIAEIDTPEEEALQKAFSYLSKKTGWLLIFDGIENPSVLIPVSGS